MSRARTLGATVVVCMGLGMLWVAGAMAENEGTFVGSDVESAEHVTTFLKGEQKPEDPLVFTSGEESQVSCPEAGYEGVVQGGTATEFFLEQEFGGTCSSGGLPGTVFTNGCGLLVKTAETVAEDAYAGVADLECPTEAGIEFKVYLGGSHGFMVCLVELEEQSGLEGAVVENVSGESAEDLTISVDAKGIAAKQSGLCGEEESETRLEGSATVSGTDELGEPVDIQIVDE